MGNCVSSQKSTEPAAMMLKSSVNSEDNCVRIESPIKEYKVNGDRQSTSQMPYEASFGDLSNNREEMYFDSQPWLESDIEDFISVNGDFTPVGSTSPIHQNSLTKNPEHDESLYISSTENSMPEASPTDMKKQLIEFFRESFNGDVDNNQNLQGRKEAKSMPLYLPSKCSNTSSYESVKGSYESCTSTKGKPAHSGQCCIPNLMRSLSFRERKKRLSPA